LMPSPPLVGLIDWAFEETSTNVILAAVAQLLSARWTAPATSLSGLTADEGDISEVERAIWIVLVGHFICRSRELPVGSKPGTSKEDGWLDTTKASIARNARMGLGRRICKPNRKPWAEYKS